MPQGCFDAAIERAVEGFGCVLGKRTLGDDDSVIVKGTVELSSGMFDRLHA